MCRQAIAFKATNRSESPRLSVFVQSIMNKFHRNVNLPVTEPTEWHCLGRFCIGSACSICRLVKTNRRITTLISFDHLEDIGVIAPMLADSEAIVKSAEFMLRLLAQSDRIHWQSVKSRYESIKRLDT